MNNSLLLGILLVTILALSMLGIVLSRSLRTRRRYIPPATPVPSQPNHPTPGTPQAQMQLSLRMITPPAPATAVSQQTSNGSYGDPQVIPGSMYLLKNRMSHLPTYRIGKQGEDEVVNCIAQVLDSRWVLFRNLVLPGENNGDIDIVLVGPGGIYALEVKTYSGSYVVRDGSWWKTYEDGYETKLKRGPGAQVRTNAGMLCNFLKSNGITYKNGVTRVVISAGQADIHVDSSGTRVWTMEELPARLASLNKRRTLDGQHIKNITDVLQRAAEYSRNRELPTTANAN